MTILYDNQSTLSQQMVLTGLTGAAASEYAKCNPGPTAGGTVSLLPAEAKAVTNVDIGGPCQNCLDLLHAAADFAIARTSNIVITLAYCGGTNSVGEVHQFGMCGTGYTNFAKEPQANHGCKGP